MFQNLPEMVTPYELIKNLNAFFVESGIDKVLPPQMGYNYTTKGMIDGVKGNHKIKKEDAIKWYIKYLTKNNLIQKTTEEVDPNQMVLDI